MRGIESIARTPREHAENKGATARRLLSELGPYHRGLFLVFVLVVLGALAQAGGPWLIGHAIDEDILGGNPMGLFRTMFLLLAIYATGTLAQRGQIRQIGVVGQSVLASLRARVFERLQYLPLGYFDRRPVGDLMSRVTNGSHKA
jgi:ATP-binding cassette subfamily B multidrug efflux pump